MRLYACLCASCVYACPMCMRLQMPACGCELITDHLITFHVVLLFTQINFHDDVLHALGHKHYYINATMAFRNPSP